MDGHGQTIWTLPLPTLDGGVVDDPEARNIDSWAAPFLELVGCQDDRTVWAFAGLDEVEQVVVDEVALDGSRWRVQDPPGRLHIATGPGFHDGRPHTLDVLGRLGRRRARLTTRHRSAYCGWLEAPRAGLLRGWIYDTTCPDRPVELTAESDGADPDILAPGIPASEQAPEDGFAPAGEIGATAAEPRPELDGPAATAGFSIVLAAGSRLAAVTLRMRDTGLLPFGLLDAVPPQGCGTACVVYRRQGPVRVAVIVTVAAGIDATMACLASLQASQDRVDREIVVVDASIDAALQRLVAERAHAAGFTYLRRDPGDGFAAGVNAGMALRPDHDVVLLDSGTTLPSGWLDRLYRAAARPRVATATPLAGDGATAPLAGDGATAPMAGDGATAPMAAGSPSDILALATVDELCRTLNAGIVRDVPSAHGACMYIRRDALSAVGPFDGSLFGPATAAQADFCARAGQAGWRHVVAADLFVGHADGAARTAARTAALLAERHPATAAALAAFARADPLRDLRNRVQLALWRAGGPCVVVVTHALPGGTGRHVERLTRDLEAAGRRVLWLRSDSGDGGGGDDGDGAGDAAAISLRTPDGHAALRYAGPAGLEAAMADLFALAPAFVHVHHLIDLPAALEALLRRSGIPYVVTLHDYFFGCPRATLLDEGGTFCDAPAVEHCTPCLSGGGGATPHADLHPSLLPYARSGPAWRGKWAAFLAGAHQVVVPSGTAAHYIGRMLPTLRLTVRPHPAVAAGPPAGGDRPNARVATRDAARVAVIGTIGAHKGAARLHELVRHCHRREPDLRFVIIGATDRDDALARYPNVEMAGSYDPDTAVATIAAAGCATALFLSVTPETYCFTLSEALLAGLVPVAFDLGAIGERLRALDRGVLVPTHSPPETIAAALRQAAATTAAPLAADAIDRVYDDLFADYYTAQPLPDPDAAPVMVAGSSGIFSDLWCTRRFGLALQSRLPLREVAITLWYHPDHLAQNATVRMTGADVTRLWVRPGDMATVRLPVRDPHASLLRIAAGFDFATALASPDCRRGAAMLAGLELVPVAGAPRRYRFEGAGEDGAVALSLVPS